MTRTFKDEAADLTDIAELDRRGLDQVVGNFADGRPYTRRELTAAFDRVAPKDNWKRPIDATIEADFDQLQLIGAAVTFFTAGEARVENLVPIAERKVGGAGKYRVTAPGYYVSCGA